MKVELELEEVRELFLLVVDRLVREAGLPEADAAAVRKWRSEAMKSGSAGVREIAEKVNADLARTLQNKAKSAIVRPDWK